MLVAVALLANAPSEILEFATGNRGADARVLAPYLAAGYGSAGLAVGFRSALMAGRFHRTIGVSQTVGAALTLGLPLAYWIYSEESLRSVGITLLLVHVAPSAATIMMATHRIRHSESAAERTGGNT